MTLVAGLDAGGSSVKAWVCSGDGALQGQVSLPVSTVRPQQHRAELVPSDWERAAHAALSQVVQRVGRPPADYAGITACSLRQGFLLLDGSDQPLGNGILNSDRRGGPFQDVLAGRHELTGHWPAPELTLPKLLAVRAEEPDRWAATRRVLFVHDWLLWLLCGVQVTEASYACAGGMADVVRRDWAGDLLAGCGIGLQRLAPVVEAGVVVGALQPGWPLQPGTPVVSGCADTQLAAMGVGGLADGVVTVVAGSSTPVQAASAAPVRDPLGRPWVSTHAAPGRWAAEGNAGYPGTFSGWWSGLSDSRVPGPGGVVAVTAATRWSEQTWSVKPPVSLVGLRPDTTAGDVAAALQSAHAFGIRGNVEDLARALGREPAAVVVTGGAAADGGLPALLAQVLGRDVHHAGPGGAARAGAALVARALGQDDAPVGLPEVVVRAGEAGVWDAAYAHWVHVTEALRTALPEA